MESLLLKINWHRKGISSKPFFKKNCFLIYVHGCFVCTCIFGVQGGQKIASEHLELVLQIMVNLLVGAGNQTS